MLISQSFLSANGPKREARLDVQRLWTKTRCQVQTARSIDSTPPKKKRLKRLRQQRQIHGVFPQKNKPPVFARDFQAKTMTKGWKNTRKRGFQWESLQVPGDFFSGEDFGSANMDKDFSGFQWSFALLTYSSYQWWARIRSMPKQQKPTLFIASLTKNPQSPTAWFEFTLPETNIAPENGWLEYYFPIGEAYFQGLR